MSAPRAASHRPRPTWAIRAADTTLGVVGGTAPDWWDTARPADPAPAPPRTEPVAIGSADCTETPPRPDFAAAPVRRGRRERRVELVDASVDGVTARVVALQLELERLEDRVAAAGWAWDAACSRRVDALHIYIEATRA